VVELELELLFAVVADLLFNVGVVVPELLHDLPEDHK